MHHPPSRIHVCSAALEAILVAIRPRPEDVIVTLGDYIDWGPDSKGVLDRLIDLGRRRTPASHRAASLSAFSIFSQFRPY